MRVGETLCDEKLKVVRLNQSLGGFASFDLAVDGDNVTGSARTGRGEIVKLLNMIWRGEYYENAGEVDGVLEGNRLKLHVQWTDKRRIGAPDSTHVHSRHIPMTAFAPDPGRCDWCGSDAES